MKKTIALVLSLLMATTSAYASWPESTVTTIVPYAAGNGTDILARILSNSLSKEFHQNFIVMNKPGASGVIGTNIVLHHEKVDDPSYHFLFNSSAVLSNPYVLKNVPFDLKRDAKIVSIVAESPLVLVTKAGAYKNFSEFEKKSQSTTMKFGIVGIGGVVHFSGFELLEFMKAKGEAIPYSSQNGALNDVARGIIDFAWAPIQSVIPYIKNHQLDALMISTSERSKVLPDVASSKELGYPSKIHFWSLVVASSDTPDDVVHEMRSAIEKSKKDVADRVSNLGVVVLPEYSQVEINHKIGEEMQLFKTMSSKYGIKAE